LYALADSFKVNEVLQNGRTNEFTVKFCDAVDLATSDTRQMGHSNLLREALLKKHAFSSEKKEGLFHDLPSIKDILESLSRSPGNFLSTAKETDIHKGLNLQSTEWRVLTL
jgi:hypothetical protein